MLLAFHIVAIAVLIAVTANISYQMGKNAGLRMSAQSQSEPLDSIS